LDWSFCCIFRTSLTFGLHLDSIRIILQTMLFYTLRDEVIQLFIWMKFHLLHKTMSLVCWFKFFSAQFDAPLCLVRLGWIFLTNFLIWELFMFKDLSNQNVLIDHWLDLDYWFLVDVDLMKSAAEADWLRNLQRLEKNISKGYIVSLSLS
jgi:hypothetical protein